MRALIAIDGSLSAGAVLDAVAPWLQASKADAEIMTVIDASEIRSTYSSEVMPSRGGERALSWLSVAGGEPEPAPQVVEDRGQAIRRVEAEVTDRLRALVNAHLPGIEREIHVVAAENTAEAIVDRARRSGADIIAMGTHGRSGLARALLGSVAEDVVRRSPVPVLIIRPDKQGG